MLPEPVSDFWLRKSSYHSLLSSGIVDVLYCALSVFTAANIKVGNRQQSLGQIKKSISNKEGKTGLKDVEPQFVTSGAFRKSQWDRIVSRSSFPDTIKLPVTLLG